MLRAPRRTNLTATLFPHTTVFRSIIMLEPRRLAARAAAERLASELGERVGETVGYRIRLDSKVGPNTRIEVVTERSEEHTSELQSLMRISYDFFCSQKQHIISHLHINIHKNPQ